MTIYNPPPAPASGLTYKGSWNANTNSPTIASGVGTQGWYYIVSVAGTTTIDGISSWAVGDWIIFNGTVWQRIEQGEFLLLDQTIPQTVANGTPIFSNLTASQAVVTDSTKHLASLGYGSSNTNSYLVQRDSTGNAAFNNVISTVTQVNATGQLIAMTYGSGGGQETYGTGNVTYNLPDATYLYQGESYYFNNNSTGMITIYKYDGTTLVGTVTAGGYAKVDCDNNTTVNGEWDIHYYIATGGTSSQFVKGDGSLASGGSGWALNGNTLGAKNTLGSIDNYDIGFLTNNTERMTILANGNVGIGTTTPAATLDVYGNVALGQTNQFKVSSTGNVTGAGTLSLNGAYTNSAGDFGVARSSTSGYIYFGNTSANYIGFSGGSFQMVGTAGATIGYGRLVVIDNAEPYSIQLRRSDGGAGGYYLGNAGNSTTNPDLVFSNTAGTEKVRIQDNGNVGIGTTSPTALLHLAAGTASASTAPLKFTSGVNLTTAEVGAIEYDGTHFFATPTGTLREMIHTGGHAGGTLTAGVTTTVTDATAKTTSQIFIQATSLGITTLQPYVSTKNNGSFVITTLTALGTETFDYLIVN